MQQFHGTWGERVVTRKTDTTLTTILYLKPNRRCSWHSHKTAYNQFYVISGMLGVVTDMSDETLTTVLTEKQSFTVQPGVFHEFRTYDVPTIVEEIAYVEYDLGDIYRQKIGGINERKR